MNILAASEFNSIAIFGGSGATGKVLISHAVTKGFKVRTLTRKASSINSVPGQVEALEGALSNPEVVMATLDGCGAAICVFGPRPPYMNIFCEKTTATIVAAMHEIGIQRLICQTVGMIGV